MIPAQIEKWVLDVVERVKAGAPTEDFRVELKSEWPDAESAYRQLAAHANAARSEPILWIIGIDERARAIRGATATELATWKPQIDSQFDGGLAPSLIWNGNIPVDEVTVVGLLFGTDRAPYVIRPTKSVELEVPWREGNRTRSARREDLIRLLVPVAATPSVELVSAVLAGAQAQDPRELEWHLEVALYFEPGIGSRVVLPAHRFAGVIKGELQLSFDQYRVNYPLPADGGLIRADRMQLILDGPGRVVLSMGQTVRGLAAPPTSLEVCLRWVPAHSTIPVEISASLQHARGLRYTT